MNEPLEIVDEHDEVIGRAERSDIHARGLLHREVHVFVTDGIRIALQRRSSGARSWQGFLDATIGGHVEVGETYLSAVRHEMQEECGLVLDESRLVTLAKLRIPARDVYQGYHNNVWRTLYGYRLLQNEVLRPEAGKSDGFEWFSYEELAAPSDALRTQTIPVILDESYIRCYKALLFSRE
ncbi:MAG: hypothetical protein RI911_436 [Candidatus Parcubacteria bacterium]|jgi:isopentenyldiphosphate isomerase